MKLREHLAGINRKLEAQAHWTANVARYTMRESHSATDTSEDLREAIARSSGLSRQESRA
jgi:selenocysteine lyase/cysteine desulfurase